MKENKEKITKGEDLKGQKYSGVAVNEADGDRVDEALVKERTSTLNNNPRNTDL